MKNIVVIDTRLARDIVNVEPRSHQTITVDKSTSLLEMMRSIRALVDYPRNKIGTLMIAAHGYAVTGADGKAHDGFGMQLCKEDLDMNSVHYFRALDGLFESHEPGITLLGCGVAAQERVIMADGGVETGFGHQLCKAIAMATSTGVKASTSLQSGDSGEVTQRIGGNVKSVSVFDPGRWEGDVWLFKPDGTKSKVTNL